MKIVFFGTPDFALPSLEAISKKHTVLSVVTTTDKPAGRGHKLMQSAVKLWAHDHNIPILQPRNLKSPQFEAKLRKLEADLFVVVAFRKLPITILSIPTYGTINLHASLLPKYRGAAPIQRAIMAGEQETGITVFKLVERIDEGAIILQEKVLIGPHLTGGELYDILKEKGALLLLKSIELLKSGNCTLHPQNDAEASAAPKIFREDCELIWSRTCEDLYNQIRALIPYPCAWFNYNNKIFKIHKARLVHKSHNLPSGEWTKVAKDLFMPCSNGMIQIFELQMEGKRVMSAEEFINGLLKD